MPWVPKRVWEAFLSDQEWLKHQLEIALDHRSRLDRVDRRLPEVAPPPPQPREDNTPPDEFWDLVSQFDSETVREQLYREAMAARGVGIPWKRIMQMLQKGMEA